MSLRVLVVDDFPDTAVVTSMLLGMRGYDCRWALTGAEALAIADEFDPDVALLDLGLPDLSGFEIARTLRTRGDKRLYLAAVTGWSDAETRARAFEVGFDVHVIKPTDRFKLDIVMRGAERARAAA